MFFGPCMADESRIRLIAFLAGDLTAVLPYVNCTMPQACFQRGSQHAYVHGRPAHDYLVPRRIAIGKADDLVDGWRTLERIRVLVNRTWAQRGTIVPSYVLRSKPPALEIYKRLPRTNCRACGEQTCMAFAASLWQGPGISVSMPPGVLGRTRGAPCGACWEICQGLGIDTTVGASI